MTPILKHRLERHRGHTVLGYAKGSAPLVIDAGAHRGEFAASVHAAWGARCHLIEASPDLFAQMHLPPSAEAHHFAVGGADGTVEFALLDNPEASSSLAREGADDRITVPARSLGSFLKEVAPDGIDVLKLDIEGAEIAALQSIDDSRLARVGQLTIEFHDFCGYVSADQVDRAIDRLKRLGFAAFRLSFHDRADTLFVNRSLCRLSFWDRTRIAVWHRFIAGLGRVALRLVRAGA